MLRTWESDNPANYEECQDDDVTNYCIIMTYQSQILVVFFFLFFLFFFIFHSRLMLMPHVFQKISWATATIFCIFNFYQFITSLIIMMWTHWSGHSFLIKGSGLPVWFRWCGLIDVDSLSSSRESIWTTHWLDFISSNKDRTSHP